VRSLILEIGKVELRKKTKTNGYFKKEEYLSYLVDMDQSEILPGVIPMLKYLKRKTKQLLWARQVKCKTILEKLESYIISTLLLMEMMLCKTRS
jgi:beta-phosphoglucomutase